MKSNKIRIILVSIAATISTYASNADSPLTSTAFWKAYSDRPEIAETFDNRSVTETTSAYLADPEYPLHLKLAMCNAMSCSDENGLNHKQLLLDWNIDHVDSADFSELDLNRLSGEQLLCIAYLFAMDNYLTRAADALPVARLAAAKLNYSYEACLILGLIEAQVAENKYVGPVFEQALARAKDKDPMFSKEAVALIFDYMKLYIPLNDPLHAKRTCSICTLYQEMEIPFE